MSDENKSDSEHSGSTMPLIFMVGALGMGFFLFNQMSKEAKRDGKSLFKKTSLREDYLARQKARR